MARTPRAAKKAASVSTRPSWPDRFLVELANRGAILPTAKAVGVGRRTVYDEMARNADFKADVAQILEQCVEEVEATLYQQALDPDKTTDRIFYLKTRKPDVYADRLNPRQVTEIREQARREALADLEEQIARLPKGARDVVLAALARAAQKELTS